MSRILVLFASSYGQTRAVAEAIARRLRTSGHTVELADAGAGRPPPPMDYDAVVIGSRVQFGKHARPVAAYVRTYRTELGAMPAAFFSVSMSAAGDDRGTERGADPNGYLAAFFAEVGWHPTRTVAFGGGLPYRRYGWWLRPIMRMLSKRGGHSTDTSRDHDYTDWAAVDRWADGFAAEVPFVPPEVTGPRPGAPLAR